MTVFHILIKNNVKEKPGGLCRGVITQANRACDVLWDILQCVVESEIADALL